MFSFARSFTLPNTVNTDDMGASYSNGVLENKLGKRAEARPKQTKVSVGGAQAQRAIEGQGKNSQKRQSQAV